MTEQVSVNNNKKKLSCDSNSETQFPLDRQYSGPAVNFFVSRAELFAYRAAKQLLWEVTIQQVDFIK